MKIKRTIKYSIAKMLAFVPDKIMVSIQYAFKTHRRVNFRDPKRFTEFVQCYKVYYRNPQMLVCADKYAVREYVAKRLGSEEILNTLYQVCNDAKEIDFSSLPSKFVIKTTDGGNGDNVLLCWDKEGTDREQVVRQVNSWRHKGYEKISREWAYKGASDSKIIVEKLLEDPNNSDRSINDYKFMCFDGKFRYLWIDKGRYSDHRRGFWDENLRFLENVESDHPTFNTPPQLPSNIRDMIRIAETLSNGFPFARIDLYDINEKIYFGEITFYPWSGYVTYHPDSFDFELGSYFRLSGLN